MMGAGVASATWGYALGREALKGVTQPDVRPTALGETGGSQPRREAFEIIPESRILDEVKARMDGRAPEAGPTSFNPLNDQPPHRLSPVASVTPESGVEGVPVAHLSDAAGEKADALNVSFDGFVVR